MNLKQLDNTLTLLRAQEILDFNLISLQIDGERVFHAGHRARSEMPQLRGFPRPNSIAARIPADDKGKVDVTREFLSFLEQESADGSFYKLTYGQVEARELRSSQNELVASKIAKHVGKMEKDSDHRKFNQTYIVSHDMRLLDGHHGWASVVVCDLLQESSTHIYIVKVSSDIDTLVKLARDFTNLVGIDTKQGL